MNDRVKSQDLTILVNTCDSYEDVLDIFFYALHQYWPNCPYPVVINAESKSYSYLARTHRFISEQSGIDDWGGRLRATLETIDSPFIMMLYDDFILEAPVENARIVQALDMLRSQIDAVVAYLIDTGLPLSNTKVNDIFIPVYEKAQYRLNSAPGIWLKDALIKYTRSGDTPWAWEVFGTYRTWGDGRAFYSLNPKYSDIFPYNHAKGGAIYRGKWVHEVVEKLITKYPIDIDWQKRGFSSCNLIEKRTMMWKLRFIKKGFEMVGWKAFHYIQYYILEKIRA